MTDRIAAARELRRRLAAAENAAEAAAAKATEALTVARRAEDARGR
jgi:hypothetical protein